MTITIKLSEPVERKLAERAARDGKTVEDVAQELIERGMAEPRTFAEIFAPIRKEFAESGMTEAELDALIEEAREEVWREQQGGRR